MKPNEKYWVSLLLKHPSIQLSLQIHSHLITTASPPSTLLFNTLLNIYSHSPFPSQALKLYKHHPTSPPHHRNTFTYSSLLKACTTLNQPIQGFQIHAKTIKLGFFNSYIYINTALLNMYLFCGYLDEGLKVFNEMPERNVVTWNAMITGLMKWGELDFARRVFDEMPCRNVVSWTGIIDGYTRGKRFVEAITLFCRMMMLDDLKPSEVTILTVLPAVWNVGDVAMVQWIHGYSVKNGFNACDIRVSNALIDVYAKCGCVQSAVKAFEEIPTKRRNVVTWTSMVSGFAMHGMAKEALKHFEEMEKEGVRPNRVTFLSVFNACSHEGLIEEGLMFFIKMVDWYQITPDIKHIACKVDMLGRAGMLEEAEKIARAIPMEMVNVVLWRTLLGACSLHENLEMGERVMEKILEREKGYGGDYVLLSNLYSGAGKFEDAERVRSMMDERNVLKVPGRCLVDSRGTGFMYQSCFENGANEAYMY